MKLITRHSDYAIRALCCIVVSKNLLSVKCLSQKLDMPYPFLRKILQALTQGGLLFSVKGRKGGFKASRPAKEISIMDVTNVFQGKFSLIEHSFKGKVCPRVKICKLKAKLDKIEKDTSIKLKKISIDSIIEKNESS